VTESLVRLFVDNEYVDDLVIDLSEDDWKRHEGRFSLMSVNAPTEVTFEEFKKIDARVGTVTQVERVPRTEKLYRILVDLGPLGIRQTLSSLVGYYEPNELVGRRIIFLYNLKPTKFSGEVSQGMLLAAEQESKLALLTTDREIPNGARIT
jgi:methionyl-tRNA synthetase